MRLAQALERMEAAAETVVDADDPPHLAAVRWYRLAADQGFATAQLVLRVRFLRSRRPAGLCAGAHVVQSRGRRKYR